MGIFDTFSPVEYMPNKLKFIIFILLLVVVAPFVNGFLLMGKGTVVCDSQRVPYVITGLDYNDLKTSGYLSAYYENAPDWVLNKNKQYWIKTKIERQRYLLSTEASTIGVKLPLAFKKVGAESDLDCVQCSLGNYTNCYDSVTETWSSMEQRTSDDFPFFSKIAYFENCREGLKDYDELIDIELVSDTEGDYWVGQIYNIQFEDFSADDLIHSTGVKYSIKYKSGEGDFVPDLFPVSCDRKFQPTVTVLGFPLFDPMVWIIMTFMYILFLWNSWAKQHKRYNQTMR